METLNSSEREYLQIKEELQMLIEEEKKKISQQKYSMKQIEREMTNHNQKLFKLSKTAGNTNESTEVFKGAVDEVNKHFREIIGSNTEVIDK